MDLGIAGRTAIVGGSSKGMGKATAIALAREGANVVICSRHSDELEQAASEIRDAANSAEVLPVMADLSKSDDIKELVAQTMKRWGHVDITVNNTGGPPPGLATDITDEQWHSGMEISFFSVTRLTQLVVPIMASKNWGRIVNILSLSVKEPEDNLAISTVARTAVVAYTKTLSLEVAKSGITINNVLPGSISTDRLQVVADMQAKFRGLEPGTGMDYRRSKIPMGRFGAPEEIADLISFLASDRAGFITGTSILVDGAQARVMN
jgi:3-oxoacyl-[acyl-carrier protein] reductase